jgi:hypothetical protein
MTDVPPDPVNRLPNQRLSGPPGWLRQHLSVCARAMQPIFMRSLVPNSCTPRQKTAPPSPWHGGCLKDWRPENLSCRRLTPTVAGEMLTLKARENLQRALEVRMQIFRGHDCRTAGCQEEAVPEKCPRFDLATWLVDPNEATGSPSPVYGWKFEMGEGANRFWRSSNED